MNKPQDAISSALKTCDEALTDLSVIARSWYPQNYEQCQKARQAARVGIVQLEESQAILAEKNKALRLVWEWCISENPSDIDGDYIKQILDL